VIVFGNLRNAIKASLVPTLLLAGAFVGFGSIMDIQIVEGNMDLEDLSQSGVTVLAGLGLLVFAMFVFAWVAVTWHRFILKEEYPDVVPSISGRPIWPYVARTLMITLQFMLLLIPLFILIMALANILFSNNVTAAIFGVAFVWFRVAISLPSFAVGEHMGSMDAWEITSEHSRDILMMSVVIIVLNSVMSMGVATLFGGLPLVAFILRIIVQWTTMMVGISVLTTLYGHIVEGRSLSGS
jgi:hypothetical protein